MELVVSLAIIVMIGSAIFLAFQSGNDVLAVGMRSMRTSFRALSLDETFRSAVRETKVAYWEKADARIEELEGRLRALPRSVRDIRVRPVLSRTGIPVGVAIRSEVDGRERETVETFGSWGVVEGRRE